MGKGFEGENGSAAKYAVATKPEDEADATTSDDAAAAIPIAPADALTSMASASAIASVDRGDVARLVAMGFEGDVATAALARAATVSPTKEQRHQKSRDAPSKRDFELVQDYDSPETEAVINDPHRSARILPGAIEEEEEADGLAEAKTLELPEPVPKPKLGAFNSVDPNKAKAFERYCKHVGDIELKRGRWENAIQAASEGLDIIPESKTLDRILTKGYVSWGNLLLSRRQWGDAAVVFRAGIDDDPRRLEGLKKGLEDANAGERTLRVATCHDKPFAYALLATMGLTLLLGALGGANVAPSSQCSAGVCLNEVVSCTEDLMLGEFSCECAPGWGGVTCEVALELGDAETGNTTLMTAVLSTGEDGEEDSIASSWDELTPMETNVLVGALLASAIAAALFASGWLALLRYHPRRILRGSVGIALLGQWGFVAYLFYAGASSVGVMATMGSIFSLLVLFIGRSWAPFVIALLEASSAVLDAHGSLLGVAYGAVVTQLLWVLVLSLALGGLPHPAVYAFLVLAAYWTLQIPGTVVHMAAAGTAASWYFVTHEHNPTAGAVRRALGSSFGTVALGGLLVALVQSLKLLLMGSRSGRASMLGGAGARAGVGGGGCFGAVAGLLELYNHYAYTQVAIYGYSYREAGMATSQLLQRVGLVPLLNNMLVGLVLVSCKLLGASCGAGAAVGLAILGGLEGFPPEAVGLLGFGIGWLTTSAVAEIVSAIITSVFICLAQNPYVLEINRPQLFEAIDEGFYLMHGYGFGEEPVDEDEDENSVAEEAANKHQKDADEASLDSGSGEEMELETLKVGGGEKVGGGGAKASVSFAITKPSI